MKLKKKIKIKIKKIHKNFEDQNKKKNLEMSKLLIYVNI